MLQYSETALQNAGELTNLNYLIENYENGLRTEMIEKFKEQILELKDHMATLQKDSEDWISTRDMVLSLEEKVEEYTNAIEENTRKVKENQEAVRQTRITLEKDLDQEIKDRIQRERDMLDGTVNMQNTMLDAIRDRYTKEWELQKKSVEKEREALEEKKSMIDELLNKRKEAEDEAEKREELAELKRQYAMISMDSTRTKDAAEMRKKIQDMEKEASYKAMEDEAKAQQDNIDDQLKAYDDFVSTGDEDLDAMLENANNFTEEINKVLQSTQEEMFNWMRENIAEYANSLQEAQKQMVNSWTDMYKQMKGITDTYWDQIDDILIDKETYIKFMMQSEEYQLASPTEQQSLLYQYEKGYDDYVAAYKDTHPEWDHNDNDLSGVGKDKPTGGTGSGSKKEGYKATFGSSSAEFKSKEEADAWLKMNQDLWKAETDKNIRSMLSKLYEGNIPEGIYNQYWTKALAGMPKG